ncbi:MAG: DNA methyltransferase [Dehalococcoidia bacterium]|nr:DNA methyltransferase [Dehalococcoidia bacterium]MDD5495244.1 DNA methyltransferase [Dehalococcoidia bacterium]
MDSVFELLTLKQACEWASGYLGKNVTVSNISYLIQYGRIPKFTNNGSTFIRKQDLIKYYESYNGGKEIDWIDKLGGDLNLALSFDYLKESERTKHVHRLHPYKGKFIPQLVRYFLDDHVDDYKKEVYFHKRDIVLDPFCGSGTTLVEANELGMHAIGIDISSFNTLISNVKISKHNLHDLNGELTRIAQDLKYFIQESGIQLFESNLLLALSDFNNKYFPSPDFKITVHKGIINEDEYGKQKAGEFEAIYRDLVSKYNIVLFKENGGTFLDKWYIVQVKKEIEFVQSFIEKITDENIRKVLSIILSRTMRSCRATTHFDLATLKEPVYSTYYCHKHGKICKPLFSILGWWLRYSEDTIERLQQFNKLRTNTNQICLTGDSRSIDIVLALENAMPDLAELVKEQKIAGIFSSPPYVGLIDYHDQHAYAYELFNLERKDHLEIGPLSNGQGYDARKTYVNAISDVLNNCKQFMKEDFDVFLVANDKFNLYPVIAQKSNMQIVNKYKRPVLNRTERDKGAYSETIFHMKS